MTLTAKASATRAALLDAAAGELAARGWDATTSTSVAARAGVATGTFYTYFPDKHAVLAALFDASLAELLGAVDEVLTAERLLDDGLHATVVAVLGIVLDGYRRHAAVIRTALGQVTVSPTVRAIYWERHAQAVEGVERFVRRGQRARLVRAGDPTVLAHALLLLTQGLNHPVLLDGDDALLAPLHAEMTRLAVHLLAPTAAS